MAKSTFGMLLLGVSGLSWAMTPLLVKIADLSPTKTLFARSLMTTVIIRLVLHFFYKSKSQSSHAKSQILIGGLAAASTCFFALACLFANPELFVPIYYTYPLFSIILDRILGNKTTTRQIVLVNLGFIGLLILCYRILDTQTTSWTGAIFALLSSLTWLGYLIAKNKYPLTETQGLFALANGQLIVCILTGIFIPFDADLTSPPLVSWLCFGILGFTSALPLFCWNWATQKIATKQLDENSRPVLKPLVSFHLAGAITMVEAPVGIFLTNWYFDLPFDPISVSGGVVILISAVLIILLEKKS